MKKIRNVIIMGAAGRDFHNFNTYFRDNPNYNVVAFTATQIPFIENRIYPPKLAGKRYPKGIPIYPEEMIKELIKKYDVDDVFFSYSDVSHKYVMNKASLVISAGASFHLLGFKDTMLKSKKPVIAVVAMRTGAGKSPTTRYVSKIIRKLGYEVGIIRHPMPYGDLEKQAVMRMTKLEDLDKYNVTIEEREDYEPHIINGFKVYSGVDYKEVLRMAERENDIIIWDGGNNDYPFIEPDLYITVVDPYRWQHIDTYYPGEINVRSADIIVITKVNTAPKENIEKTIKKVRDLNRKAKIVTVGIKITPEKDMNLKEKKVLVIEDGPTVTHGEMPYGAGYLYAKAAGAYIIDPKPYLIGTVKDVVNKYPHIENVLPAVGYSEKQMKELEEIINASDAQYIISATPTRLERYLNVSKPIIHINYELEDIDGGLAEIIQKFIAENLNKHKMTHK
jgi:predicted GTPase